jgi:hypothetical protein
MFGNKKNTLPPKPKPPNIEEILQDLKMSTNNNDIVFKLLAHGNYIIKCIKCKKEYFLYNRQIYGNYCCILLYQLNK